MYPRTVLRISHGNRQQLGDGGTHSGRRVCQQGYVYVKYFRLQGPPLSVLEES